LSDAPGLVRWWPEVYLDVREVEPDVFSLHTRGWLPYTLRWSMRRVESRSPYGFTVHAGGDLEGTGTWTFEPDGEWTNITYTWKIRARKPILRWLSFLLKPIFSANHRWAMACGEKALVRELERLRNQ
jgi:hypothetical protein